MQNIETTSEVSRDDTLRLVRGRSSIAPDRPWVEVHGSSDIGRVRQRNEDQFLIAELGRTIHVLQTSIERADDAVVQNRAAGLFVVADGMGGHGGGDVASTVATDAIAQYVFEMMPWMMRIEAGREEEFSEELRRALKRCQTRVEQVAENKGMTSLKMGTTLTMAYVLWPGMYVVHAGDSRGYLYRGGTLLRLTRDHTLAEQIASLHPTAPDETTNQFQHVLVNCVGGGTEELDAEIHRTTLAPGDTLLLCTDGLTRTVTDDEIRQELEACESAETSCDRLIALANDRGGQDNVTTVIVRF